MILIFGNLRYLNTRKRDGFDRTESLADTMNLLNLSDISMRCSGDVYMTQHSIASMLGLIANNCVALSHIMGRISAGSKWAWYTLMHERTRKKLLNMFNSK